MPKYRVLTIDGGGLRGVVTSVILDRLSREIPGCLDDVALMAGTSTGGLIALALRRGLAPAAIRDLYLQRGKDIFSDNFFDNVLDFGKIRGADYSSKPREKVCKDLLGATTVLGDLNGGVMVTAFDLDNESPAAGAEAPRRWKPKIFHNVPSADNNAHSDMSVLAYKAAMMTSAAPTYFPSYEGMVDGGVFANNPSMCALAQTQDTRNVLVPNWKDIRLLSLGTGTSAVFISGATHDWGYAQWATRISDLMIDGVMGVADFQCRTMLGEKQYHRFAPFFDSDRKVELDNVEKLGWMRSWAESLDLTPLKSWMQANWI